MSLTQLVGQWCGYCVQVLVDLISQAPVTAKESLYGIKFLCEQSTFHAQVSRADSTVFAHPREP